MQLGMAVAQFRGGAEPALRGPAINWNIFATAIHRAKRKHGTVSAAYQGKLQGFLFAGHLRVQPK
jgi:hypothetical protein